MEDTGTGAIDRPGFVFGTKGDLVIRRFRAADIPRIDALWKKHHSHQFSIPPLYPSIIDCVIEHKGEILAFGNLKVFAETVMVMDHDKPAIVRARAFREIMPVAIMGAQRSGISQIHAVAQDPDFAQVLRKHYGFTDVLGEHLLLEVL